MPRIQEWVCSGFLRVSARAAWLVLRPTQLPNKARSLEAGSPAAWVCVGRGEWRRKGPLLISLPAARSG